MSDAMKHRLPSFPEGVGATFRKLAQRLPEDEVHELNTRLTQAVRMIAARDAKQHSGLGTAARRIADRCAMLLDRYPQFREREQALIVGAARYFILQRDSLPDDTPFLGLEDDVQVINYVLAELGLSNQAVELDLLE